ncbi:MAG: DMT family transporter [Rhodobacter sp.]|nr:DMT family transporter [Rhodobacter sp.]
MTAHPPLHAAVWMIGAIVSFTAMAIAGRALADELDTFEIMTYRSFIGIAIVLGGAWWAQTLTQITRRSLHIHFIRNISHFTGQNLWFYAVTAAPLAQVFALEFTSPLWVTVFAPIFLGERLTRVRALAALLGFCGILIVAQPGSGVTLSPGLIAAALAAIGFAGAATFTRLLTRTETITCILFYLTTMQAVFGLITAGFDGAIAWPSPAAWPWLVLVGCAGLVAHFCMTKALAIAPATVVMPMDFARLPIIALVGMALYSEPLEWAVLAGAAVIFAANYLNIRGETRAHAAG